MADNVTANGAIVLYWMMKEPTADHTVPALSESSGVNVVTARQNLIKLETKGWVVSKQDDRRGRQYQPPVRWMLTANGRRKAELELETWDIEEVPI